MFAGAVAFGFERQVQGGPTAVPALGIGEPVAVGGVDFAHGACGVAGNLGCPFLFYIFAPRSQREDMHGR